MEREKARQQFGESHRTLIGHFRHEVGHYYWQRLVENQCADQFRVVFGDHDNPSYSAARDSYYQNDPTANWPQQFISAYASMHPWEDFAETFSKYLSIISVVDTAAEFDMAASNRSASFQTLVDTYVRLGIITNELNREMGLLDLAPDVLVSTIVDKLEFIHSLVKLAN